MDVFTIYEIEKIEILNDYYRGKFNGNIRAWQRKKSNGVKNYIEIYKKNGEYNKYFFLQTKAENIRMFSDELRTYYRFGKLKCKVKMFNENKETVCTGILAGMIM